MIERDVFSSEILEFDLPIIRTILNLRDDLLNRFKFASSIFMPRNCSEILSSKDSKKKYNKTNEALYYEHNLYADQKKFIDEKTEQIFQAATGIKRRLNIKNSNDLLLLRSKWRLRDCILRNEWIKGTFFNSENFHMLDNEEETMIKTANNTTSISYLYAQQKAAAAIDIFRDTMTADLSTKTDGSSFFGIALKYLFLTAAFVMLNYVSGGLAAGAAGTLGSVWFRESAKMMADKIVEDVGDAIPQYVSEKGQSFKNLSLNEYIVSLRYNNDEIYGKLKKRVDLKTQETMAMIVGSIWRSKAERKEMLNGYLKEMDLLKKQWESFDNLLQEQVGILLTSWINSKFKKKVSFRVGYDQIQGVIQFEFDLSKYSLEYHFYDKQMTFDPRKTNVIIKSPLSENIVSGLKEIMMKSNEGIWSNPFDMPVNKFLRLRFHDAEEVHILLMLGKRKNYPNNISNKSSPSAYHEYTITYSRYYAPSKGKTRDDPDLIEKGISRQLGNELLRLFFDDYRTTSLRHNYLGTWETKKIVKRVTRNKLMNKPFDYYHNQSW